MSATTMRTIGTLLFFGLLVSCDTRATAAIIVQQGDASIAHDPSAGTWTLSAGGAVLTLALDPSRDFAIVRLLSASGVPWTLEAAADSTVRVGGRTLAFGNRPAGFAFENAGAAVHGATLQLDAAFRLAADNLTVTRHYAIVSGSPTFEAWTTYGGTGVSDRRSQRTQITIPTGTLHWLTGLQGDAANIPTDAAFTLQQQVLETSQPFTLGATYRASEHAVPWFSIDGGKDEFFGALMWSGAWSAARSREPPSARQSPSAWRRWPPRRSPPWTDRTSCSASCREAWPRPPPRCARTSSTAFAADGRSSPLVTYNTWFAYGTEIDEASMRAEMDRAAALGVELFVIDAGWYAGAGTAGPFDFDAGLGGWTADPARFPNGLAPLSDYAHSLGMKFGIWVEPERVNLSLVGAAGRRRSMAGHGRAAATAPTMRRRSASRAPPRGSG